MDLKIDCSRRRINQDLVARASSLTAFEIRMIVKVQVRMVKILRVCLTHHVLEVSIAIGHS